MAIFNSYFDITRGKNSETPNLIGSRSTRPRAKWSEGDRSAWHLELAEDPGATAKSKWIWILGLEKP